MFKKTTPDKDYVPNKVSLGARLGNLVLAVLLIFLGGYGILKEELYLPLGRRTEVTLYGDATYVAMVAFSLGAIYFLLEIVDHYDKRNNEHIYRAIKDDLQRVRLHGFYIGNHSKFKICISNIISAPFGRSTRNTLLAFVPSFIPL